MISNPVALAGLFQQFGALKSSEVTVEVVNQIVSVLKLPATEEGIALAVNTIKSGDLESLADYVGQPERLKQLMGTIAGPGFNEPPLARCPHCSGVFELHFEAAGQ